MYDANLSGQLETTHDEQQIKVPTLLCKSRTVGNYHIRSGLNNAIVSASVIMQVVSTRSSTPILSCDCERLTHKKCPPK